jgi:hypothetical protein
MSVNKPADPLFAIVLGPTGKRALLYIGIGAVAAVVMLVLTGEYVAFHCMVLAAVTLAAALSSAWTTASILPQASPRAGMLGGMLAALAYVLVFIAVYFVRFVTLDNNTAAILAGKMSTAQATALGQQGIMPGVEYFRGEYLAYMVGYLLFGLIFGMLLGAVAGLLVKRMPIAKT